MRATRSDDTILEGAFVPDKYVARVLPMGFAGADLFVLGIFAWALLGFANIYYGLARRVTDLTVNHVKSKGFTGDDAFYGLAPRRFSMTLPKW